MSLRASDVFAPCRKRRRKPERAIQKAILVWLRTQGCLAVVTDAGAAYRAGVFFGDAIPAGWPDITGLLPDGRFIGIECKAPKGRQSAVQKRMAQEIHRRQGIYILARGVEDVEKGIEDADRRPTQEQH